MVIITSLSKTYIYITVWLTFINIFKKEHVLKEHVLKEQVLKEHVLKDSFNCSK